MFPLKTSAGLGCPAILDFDSLPTDEQFSSIGIDRDQGIGFIEVNAHWKNPLGFWDLQSQSESSKQFPIALNNRQAIVFKSTPKEGFEILWNAVVQMLPTSNRPDRQGAVRAEISITPTFPNQEQRTGFLEEEWAGSGFLIGFGTRIGPGNQTNSGNSHLRTELTFHLMIASSLQSQCAKGFSSL
jgi:hypothetical protein